MRATGFLTYGKLRAAYGQSGTQPPPYLLTGTYVSQTINDGGWGPATSTAVAGVAGLITNFNLPTQSLGPERVKEFEAGFDLGLFNDKADLSVTHYRQNSDDLILQIPVPTSTGYFQVAANAASTSEPWLGGHPESAAGQRDAASAGMSGSSGPATGASRRRSRRGLQFYQFPLSGGGNGAGLTVGGVAQPGVPIAAYRGSDFKRCGRGLTSDLGTDIDSECGGAAAGTLYIGASGFPELDLDQTYIIGDPNPDWTGSVRTNFRIGKLSLGGLLDVRAGGIAYNGTKGALQHFGVAQITADTRNAAPVRFGADYYPINEDPTNPSKAVAGPGVGTRRTAGPELVDRQRQRIQRQRRGVPRAGPLREAAGDLGRLYVRPALGRPLARVQLDRAAGRRAEPEELERLHWCGSGDVATWRREPGPGTELLQQPPGQVVEFLAHSQSLVADA